MVAQEALLSIVTKFFDHDPAVAARYLEDMQQTEAGRIFQALPPTVSARAVKHLQISYVAELLKDAADDVVGRLTTLLDPQYAAALLMYLSAEDRERFSSHFSEKLKDQVRDLLDYPEGSVGRIMTTDFLTFRKDVRAQEAVDRIRALARKNFPLSYVYVTDEQGHLAGILNMRDLMLAPLEAALETIMRKELFTLHCFADQQQAADELAKRKFFAAPVVDGENNMLGIIKAERMIQGIRDDVTRDMQKMFGAGGDERVSSSTGFALRKRLPWLLVNLATAFLAASVVAMFEGIIAKLTVLAVFLPVVAGQGGNAGAQSLAVVMRGIVMREIPKNRILYLVVKEGKLGALNGVFIGLVTAAIAWIWYGNPFLGVVIGLGMLVNLVCAGLSGAAIPLLMKKAGIDPAQSSSIILTTVTDVIGFLAFLGFAVVFQRFLI